MTIESIFRFYTNEAKPYMTLFESKCAIVRGLGAELPMRQIIDILELECNWKKTDRYLALENFGKLYNIVELAEKKNKPRSHYEKFDLRRRGWIVEDDVYRVRKYYYGMICVTRYFVYTLPVKRLLNTLVCCNSSIYFLDKYYTVYS